MVFENKLGDFQNVMIHEVYKELWPHIENKSEDDRRYFNLVMMEADAGCPFVDRIDKRFPGLFKKK